MKLRQLFFSLILLVISSSFTFGQSDDLQIFGYFQDNFHHTNYAYNTDTPPLYNYNSFNMQQMDIFFSKNFGNELSAFANLEFTDSYSSIINVGALNIQEAWIKYSPSSIFNLKAGVLIPRFNNFNEIKNRTVLLPYILRPIVYETIFANQLGTGDFVPQQANLQVYGEAPLGDIRVNYAAFMGNLTPDNYVQNGSPLGIGDDTSHYKMFGGRLGLETDNLALGVSGTYDRKNLWAYGIGDVPRMRFGAYLNFSISGFEFESEYIRVYNKLTSEDNEIVAMMDMYSPYAPKGFNKYFYHTNLLYNFTDKIFAYGGYDYFIAQDNVYAVDGDKVFTFGCGYKVNDSVVLKAQYYNAEIPSFNVKMIDYLLGVSVYF